MQTKVIKFDVGQTNPLGIHDSSSDSCVGVLLGYFLINFMRLQDVFRCLFQSVVFFLCVCLLFFFSSLFIRGSSDQRPLNSIYEHMETTSEK